MIEIENVFTAGGLKNPITFREIRQFAATLQVGQTIQKVEMDYTMGAAVTTNYKIVKLYPTGVLLKSRCCASPSYMQLMTQPEWRIHGKPYWQLVGRRPNNPDTRYR